MTIKLIMIIIGVMNNSGVTVKINENYSTMEECIQSLNHYSSEYVEKTNHQYYVSHVECHDMEEY